MSSSAGQKRTCVLQSDYFIERKHTVYSPLDPEQREIRLLQLQPGQWSDPITATLSVACLDDGPKYEAISYVWGDLDNCREIKLHGLEFRVTISQFTVLRRLRLADRPRTLWIDATCIDQLNISERGHQVGFMFDIYKAASGTIIWFGEMCDALNSPNFDKFDLEVGSIAMENASSLLTMKAKAEIVPAHHQQQFQHYVRGGEKEEEEIAEQRCQDKCQIGASCIVPVAMRLLRFFSKIPDHLDRQSFRVDWIHPNGEYLAAERAATAVPIINTAVRLYVHSWWRRVWTLQESRIPQLDAVVCIGPHQLTLKKLTHAAQKLGKIDLADLDLVEMIGRKISFGATFLNFTSNRSIIRRLSCDPDSARYSLKAMLFITESRLASDERDLIYALFGPTNFGRHSIRADYELSVDEVFLLATYSAMMEDNSLDLLEGGLTTPYENPRRLPSWVPDYTRRYAGWSFAILRRKFRSSGPVKLRDISCDKEPRTLMLTGTRISTVSHVGPEYSCDLPGDAEPDRSWDIFVRNAYSWYLKVIDTSRAQFDADKLAMIWRVCLHKTPEDIKVEETQEGFRSVSDWLREQYDDCGCGIDGNVEKRKQLTGAMDNVELPFSKAIRDSVSGAILGSLREGTVLFRTDNGQIGSAMPYALPGDEVFIVGGGRMPLLLRSVHDEGDSEPSTVSARATAESIQTDDSESVKNEADDLKQSNTARQVTPRRTETSHRYRYRLVSACYVDGIMFGEAVTPETEWADIGLI